MRQASTLVILLLVLPLARAGGEVTLQSIGVRQGDTLWAFSQKYLQDANRWEEVLQHNGGLSSDPAVALPPGNILVPLPLLKGEFRAAQLFEAMGTVLSRPSGKPVWKPIPQGGLLYAGDGLRTRKSSFASVEFEAGSVLRLDPDSMVVVKPLGNGGRHLSLRRGVVHAISAGVATSAANIRPRGAAAKFTARVGEDLTTEVKVFAGTVDVEDLERRKQIVVKAGQSTLIADGRLPDDPRSIRDIGSDKDARTVLAQVRVPTPPVKSPLKIDLREQAISRTLGAPTFEVFEDLGSDITTGEIDVGVAVAAYHVQVSRSEDFINVILDRMYDPFAGIGLKTSGLPPGSYFYRVASIDLLQEQSPYSGAKAFRLMGGEKKQVIIEERVPLELIRPVRNLVWTDSHRYWLRGRAGLGWKVSVDGKVLELNPLGYFTHKVLLKEGPNDFAFSAVNEAGDEKILKRIIDYRPRVIIRD